MRFATKLMIATSAAVGLLSVSASAAPPESAPAMVIEVDRSNASLTYVIDGVRCCKADAGVTKQLLDAIGDAHKGRDESRTVAVVITLRVPLEQFGTIKGMAMKVGFEQVRYFLKEADTGRIVEVLFGSSFSLVGTPGDMQIVPQPAR